MNTCLVKFLLYFLSLTVLDIIRIPETSAYSVNSSFATYNFARTRRQARTRRTVGCKLPDHPENGKWSIHDGAAGNPGQTVGENSLLVYSCNKGYKRSRESGLLACLPDGWSGPHPSCLKLCPALYNTAITRVRCFDEDHNEIKCDEATDQSSAKFECAYYYEPTDRHISIRHCWSGSWNLPPPECIPICGEKRLLTGPLIAINRTVEQGNYPWVTAVFQKTGEGFINVCGGSMLNQKVIVTAAHCVADKNGQPLDETKIKVAVGKYYRKYMDERDTQAQYSDVQKILVHPRYRGDSQRYSSDIAFLVTKDTLLLSRAVQPVCYRDLPIIHLTAGLKGVIAGWGHTTDGTGISEELKETSVSFKDDATCISELTPVWMEKYNTYDKLCAGQDNKSIAECPGNSGGGLVFKNPRDGRFYIHGILSVGKKENNVGCDVSNLYTNVAVHYERLEQTVSQNTRH